MGVMVLMSMGICSRSSEFSELGSLGSSSDNGGIARGMDSTTFPRIDLGDSMVGWMEMLNGLG